ncbi:UDP-N-acetylmuramoyl-tripeptide--D-alanyl-D-alanine ligase [Shewanella sp. NIFS-20-20]|uniref:UDP-N-acetylmuramoyl-tripeptide--D-alanyl-D- alanine ligase n=1 Tax=Shewanella sp. NIFS-20-20 TaxID=2853806 RepID=UPI001C484604|nr:UDP-N-acetylmuramoyl-tripeptide--D-alanyl-D-alanine ligase [Shewanella sp. NIFS-20-20]MBV7315753.1 UDP-N-acetylmuramoyl-tripeptide--D-alanyl-D-alanine ligase [Shewanella sp. NIFS-20-20]
MIPLSISTLAKVLSGQLQGEDSVIYSVSTDSRDCGDRGLFIALTGDKFDGHMFAASALANGAIALVVERVLPLDVAQIVVADCHQALGQLGAYVRQQVQPLCLALTGSNGKTSVKEMLATIAKQSHNVLYTAGNFNNDIGVPLTLLRLEPQHQVGVFELGANHLGEIDYTSGLVQPKVAMVNNVASAHLEGFGSLAGVATAKSEIFNHLAADGVAVINRDDDFYEVMQQAAKDYRQLTFAIDNDADVRALDVVADSHGCYGFTLVVQAQRYPIKLALAGRHQVLNALAATAMSLGAGFEMADILAGLAQLQPVKGRMLPLTLGRFKVIDDSYNANPNSVAAAIDYLAEIQTERCLVLGDLGELGDNAPLLHAQLGSLARQKGIKALFCTGQLSAHTSAKFGAKHHADIDQLILSLISYLNQLPSNATVLVKGSRSARMERVVAALAAAFERGELV